MEQYDYDGIAEGNRVRAGSDGCEAKRQPQRQGEARPSLPDACAKLGIPKESYVIPLFVPADIVQSLDRPPTRYLPLEALSIATPEGNLSIIQVIPPAHPNKERHSGKLKFRVRLRPATRSKVSIQRRPSRLMRISN